MIAWLGHLFGRGARRRNATPVETYNLTQENGGAMLQEDGAKILWE
jgi:hypothetical protein